MSDGSIRNSDTLRKKSPPRRWQLLMASLVGVITMLATAPNPASANEPQETIPALGDVVCTTNGETWRIRLHVSIRGVPLRQWFRDSQKSYVQRLFAQLDQNADGQLDEAEARRAPPPVIRLENGGGGDNVNVAFNFAVVDGNGDGHATDDELLAYYETFSDGCLHVRLRNLAGNTAGADARLWSILDTNDDGKLSESELRDTSKLMELDVDNNEVLSLNEFVVGRALNRAGAAAGMMAPNRRRQRAVKFTSVMKGDPTCSVSVRYPLTDEGIVVHEGSDSGVRPNRTRRTVWVDAHGFTDLSVLPVRRRAQSRRRTSLFREFSAATDGANTLSFSEALPAGLKTDFGLLDGDGDDALTSDEVNAFAKHLLPAEMTMRESRLTLTVLGPQAGLFGLLDRDGDSRLGRRELLQSPKMARRADQDEDGALDRTEIDSSLQLVLARDSWDEGSGAVGDAGPPWFYRSDGNLDGDLSRREFAGRPERFKELDADKDGLISLDEALAADDRLLEQSPKRTEK